MNREQLAHAIRVACSLTGSRQVIVIGSQSILASWGEHELPEAAFASTEADIFAEGETAEATRVNADLITGVAGEMSQFDDTHGFHLDGVDEATAVLPPGWRDRLVVFAGAATVDVITGEQYVGLCLAPEDLCVAKLIAGREKDRRFVRAVLAAGLVRGDLVRDRLDSLPAEHAGRVERALGFISDHLTAQPPVGGPST